MSDVREAGGRFGVREFRDRSEVLALEEPVVLTCTGLGAAALFAMPNSPLCGASSSSSRPTIGWTT
jgi:hypothetical protein